ncbi:MAG: TraR/DksA family transcriptional regulator [Nitrospina sp.]|jgi:DnaK suppressor protein|nr:TraR/DksA family transcriptional regulator [Nitrospina sp.]MBT3413909.1 TraR/DksA family transcriptional regulator [Nitrospina sp.]MBT3856499.1 TraR/DksA family transcriptional regulator [Nitrospina sp.]MBT4103288.1 TraR/DksA family transcriptional regulator [Nitrospina sp.]MBT4389400.1 TraR/DksA family transcriptional regulator [Nitrospina sp.]
MNKKKMNQFRSQLESIRSELLGDVEKSKQHVKESEAGQMADISDHAASTYSRQLEGELGEQEWQKLKQVDMAIEKIAEGEYGVCAQCEAAIPEARLKVVPYTEFCTQCLSEMEKNPKAASINDQDPLEED